MPIHLYDRKRNWRNVTRNIHTFITRNDLVRWVLLPTGESHSYLGFSPTLSVDRMAPENKMRYQKTKENINAMFAQKERKKGP